MTSTTTTKDKPTTTSKKKRKDFTDKQLLEVYRDCNENASKAAELLEVPRRTFHHWIKGIQEEAYAKGAKEIVFTKLSDLMEEHGMSSEEYWEDEALKRQEEKYQNEFNRALRDHLHDSLSHSVLSRAVLKEPQEDHENQRILVISDMHIPYHHPDMIEFLSAINAKYAPTRIIGIGDEIDSHAMSFHSSDPDLDSAGTELSKARAVVKDLYELFPKMDIVHSNHGSMLYRRGKEHGIPKHMLKSYNEVLGVGEGWQWYEDITVELPTADGSATNGNYVNFHHGRGADVGMVSRKMGMSCVQGHYHSKFKIDYWGNPLSLNFAMNVGCLIDDHSLAFAYNKIPPERPVIGCGIIIDGHPKLIPLVKLKNGRWNGEIQ